MDHFWFHSFLPYWFPGDFRPYFTIFDRDFDSYRGYMQSRKSDAPVVIGATNSLLLQYKIYILNNNWGILENQNISISFEIRSLVSQKGRR